MNLHDSHHVTGDLLLQIFKNNLLIEQQSHHNLVVFTGRCTLAKLITGTSNVKINQVGIGTGTAAPTDSDSHLTNCVLLPLRIINSNKSAAFTSNSDAIFTFEIQPHDCNQMLISEFGLFTSDNILFSRRIRSGAIFKEDDMEIRGTWTIHF